MYKNISEKLKMFTLSFVYSGEYIGLPHIEIQVTSIYPIANLIEHFSVLSNVKYAYFNFNLFMIHKSNYRLIP
jgi:hypothetical protein